MNDKIHRQNLDHSCQVHGLWMITEALVDGLETEGVEQMWSKLNQANSTEYRGAAPDGWLFYADPENFLKKKRTRCRRKKAASTSKQLLLFGDL